MVGRQFHGCSGSFPKCLEEGYQVRLGILARVVLLHTHCLLQQCWYNVAQIERMLNAVQPDRNATTVQCLRGHLQQTVSHMVEQIRCPPTH